MLSNTAETKPRPSAVCHEAAGSFSTGIIDGSEAAHELHLLDVPDEIGKRRLRERNAGGEHPFQASDAEYDLFARYFVPPAADEGFNVIVHRQ